MKYFHGAHRRRSYFEGWYCKHAGAGGCVALIPAYHVGAEGRPTASLQLITQDFSHTFAFPAKDFSAEEDCFHVRLGDCEFSQQGCTVSLHRDGWDVEGSLRYSPLTPLHGDIMGPFRFLPMECSHGVVSLSHGVEGSLRINGAHHTFHQGTGYIETDRGASFPRRYLWAQCGWQQQAPACVMVSVAEIPFLGARFTGCIAAVLWQGQEYRFATYQGVHIRRWSSGGVVLRQGRQELLVEPLEQASRPLQAPVRGTMTRIIREAPACTLRCQFCLDGHVVFDRVCPQSGFEYADMAEDSFHFL